MLLDTLQVRQPGKSRRAVYLAVLGLLMCLPFQACRRPREASSLNQITLYGFSVVKEPLEKEIFPAFQREWKEQTGQEVKFASSFGGSELITNQIISGVPTDVAIVAIERNAERLKTFGATHTDWHSYPYEGIINRSPFVIVVRKGNPKDIRDFADLGKPGIRLIHPDPISSGGAQWSVTAIYGSELIRTELSDGKRDPEKALSLLRSVWKNVIATPESTRQARTQFESGFGDALITYELEGLQMIERKFPVEIVMPRATILSEHTVVLIDRRMKPAKRQLVEAFIKYLWSDVAQKAFVRYHFRPITDDTFEGLNPGFRKVEHPFTIADLGGWPRAHREIIENAWKYKIQAMK